MTRAFVTHGRRLLSSLMEDTVVISRLAGESGTLDPVTGQWTPTAATTVYNGPGRVHFPTPAEQTAIFGETPVTTTRAVVSLPYDAPEVLVEDVALINGRVFKVIATPPPSTFNMRRQIGCEIDE